MRRFFFLKGNKHRSLLIVLAAAAIMIVQGCSAKQHTVASAENQLEKRVRMEWDLKMQGDWPAAYELTSAAYREGRKKENFGQKSNVTISQYDISDITISNGGEKADVKVAFNVIQRGIEFTFYSKEVWIWENGNWYLTGE